MPCLNSNPVRLARRCAIGFAVCALGLAAPAVADPARGLPEGWSMADDATYAPSDKRWYRAPAARRGTYAHGASGELGAAAVAEAEAKRCMGSDPHIEVQGEEYWYFEAGGEALLLLKTNAITGYDDSCNAVVEATYSVERATIGRDGFTLFAETGAGWLAETHRFVEFRRDDIDDIGVGNGWPALKRFVMRKRRLSDSDRGERIGKVQTHCVAYSSPPDGGGGQCWVAGSGPGKGIVTYDYEVIAGSQYINQWVTELEDGVALDGRLFEWDRPIRGRGAEGEGKDAPRR